MPTTIKITFDKRRFIGILSILGFEEDTEAPNEIYRCRKNNIVINIYYRPHRILISKSGKSKTFISFKRSYEYVHDLL